MGSVCLLEENALVNKFGEYNVHEMIRFLKVSYTLGVKGS